MTELEKTKRHAIEDLKNICAKCKSSADHICPVGKIINQIEDINGIPVIVNSKLWHVVFHLTPALSEVGEGERVR